MTWLDSDDQDLLEHWKRTGDESSARVLVERHYPRMLNLFYRLTGTRAQAEELAQDLFMRLTEQAGRGTVIGHPRAWLHASAMNLWRDWIRHEAVARAKGIPHSGGDEELQRVPAESASAQNELEHQMVKRAVLSLGWKHREVLVLCHYQGLTYEEAAKALDIPVGTVRSRLHGAVEALRERINPKQVKP